MGGRKQRRQAYMERQSMRAGGLPIGGAQPTSRIPHPLPPRPLNQPSPHAAHFASPPPPQSWVQPHDHPQQPPVNDQLISQLLHLQQQPSVSNQLTLRPPDVQSLAQPQQPYSQLISQLLHLQQQPSVSNQLTLRLPDVQSLAQPQQQSSQLISSWVNHPSLTQPQQQSSQLISSWANHPSLTQPQQQYSQPISLSGALQPLTQPQQRYIQPISQWGNPQPLTQPQLVDPTARQRRNLARSLAHQEEKRTNANLRDDTNNSGSTALQASEEKKIIQHSLNEFVMSNEKYQEVDQTSKTDHGLKFENDPFFTGHCLISTFDPSKLSLSRSQSPNNFQAVTSDTSNVGDNAEVVPGLSTPQRVADKFSETGKLYSLIFEVKDLLRRHRPVTLSSKGHWLEASITEDDINMFAPEICYSPMTFRILMTTADVPAGWILVPSDFEAFAIPIDSRTTDLVFICFRPDEMVGPSGGLTYLGHWFTVHVQLKIAQWTVTSYDSLDEGDWTRQCQECVHIVKVRTGRTEIDVSIAQGACPKQSDGYSCGPLAWQAVERLLQTDAHGIAEDPIDIRIRLVNVLKDKLTRAIGELEKNVSSTADPNVQEKGRTSVDQTRVSTAAVYNKLTRSESRENNPVKSMCDAAADNASASMLTKNTASSSLLQSPSATSLGKRKSQDTAIDSRRNDTSMSAGKKRYNHAIKVEPRK